MAENRVVRKPAGLPFETAAFPRLRAADVATSRLAPHDLIAGKRIAVSWGGAVRPDRDILWLHALLAGASVPLQSLLTRRYPLARINEALDDLEAGRVWRPLIAMPHAEAVAG